MLHEKIFRILYIYIYIIFVFNILMSLKHHFNTQELQYPTITSITCFIISP